jgi:Ser/Thr protein kinase RdoA (MazF antagonist)
MTPSTKSTATVPSPNLSSPALSLDVFAATMVGHATPMSLAEASAVAREFYAVDGTAELLTGERDENFRLTSSSGSQYVLKVSSPAEDPVVTDLPTAAMLHLEQVDPGLPCPRVLRDREGRSSLRYTDRAGHLRTVRLLTWLPGLMLQSSTRSAAQRRACGAFCARLARGLRDFHHPAARRPLLWDYRHFGRLDAVLADVRAHEPDYAPAEFVSSFLARYHAEAEPHFDSLRQQVLHNDMNLRNVLVAPDDPSKVVGVIDFGDIVDSVLVGDVAIMANAQITSVATLETDVLDAVRAYHAVEPLQPDELLMLPWLIAARLVMGILIPAWHQLKNPGNAHFIGKKEAEIAERIEMHRVLMRADFSLDRLRQRLR